MIMTQNEPIKRNSEDIAVKIGIAKKQMTHFNLHFAKDSKSGADFMTSINDKYKIYQYNTDNYKDYDIFCFENENGGHIQLTPKTEQARTDLIADIKQYYGNDIQCSVVITTEFDKEKLHSKVLEFIAKAPKYFNAFVGRFELGVPNPCKFHRDKNGNVASRVVNTDDIQYFIMKKGARNKGKWLFESDIFDIACANGFYS